MRFKIFSFVLALLFVFIFISTIIFASVSINASANVLINEILPNPNSDWNGNGQNETYDDEWIELYNTESTDINLSGWILGDKVKNYTLNNILICADCFLVLYGSNTSLQLNNNNEEIYLYNNASNLVDQHNYASSSKDKTFGRCPDAGDWQQDLQPTPNASNNCSSQEKILSLNYQSEVECNENFTIKINAENFDPGIYDVKIDIKDIVTDNRVAKVWNGTKWISTTYYVNNILTINENGTGQCSLTFKVEDFSGEVYLKPTIRDLGSFEQHSLSVSCNQSNQSTQEESEIKIVDAPAKAKFGEKIELEINVYKGDTSKYAVYIYAEDQDGKDVSDKIILHFKTKYSNQTIEVELQLKCKNETGNYDIVVEGLDTEDREEIELTSCDDSDANDADDDTNDDVITIGDFSYGLTIPNTINPDKEFTVKLKITNNGDEEKNFDVWSYVYRGPKCYSCSDNETRESNAKSITIQSGSSVEVELENIVKEAEPGSYKLKIKALQEGLKTPKEFTYNITIKEQGTSQSSQGIETDKSNNQDQSIQSAPSITGSIIESKSFSFNRALPYILATICALLVIYIIIKKI